MEEEKRKEDEFSRREEEIRDSAADSNAGAPQHNEPEDEEIILEDCSEKSSDEEWAETLGMDFDPERAATPPPTPGQLPPPPAPQQFQQQPPQWQQPQQFGQQSNFQQPQPQFRQGPIPPQPHSGNPKPEMPKAYMVWSIITTVLMCMPAGVVAIVYSSLVSSRYYAGDYAGAERASQLAQIWIIVSIVTGVIGNTLYFPFMLLSSGI